MTPLYYEIELETKDPLPSWQDDGFPADASDWFRDRLEGDPEAAAILDGVGEPVPVGVEDLNDYAHDLGPGDEAGVIGVSHEFANRYSFFLSSDAPPALLLEVLRRIVNAAGPLEVRELSVSLHERREISFIQLSPREVYAF